MEKYYWFSARDRRKILLQTFVKSWKWILCSVIEALVLYFLFYNLLKNAPFAYLLSLLTSLSLFWVVVKKEKLLQKSVFCFRCCYVAATGVIVFWMMFFNGLLCFALFLLLATLLFLISPWLNKLPFDLTESKVKQSVFVCILCFMVINFVLVMLNISQSIFSATTFCLIFMFFNAMELKQMDKFLQKGLMEEEIQTATENWCFDMFGNFIGMIFFSESVRFISKLVPIIVTKKAVSI